MTTPIRTFVLRSWTADACDLASTMSVFAPSTKKFILLVKYFDSRVLTARSSSAWATTANSSFLTCGRLLGPTVNLSNIPTCFTRRFFARSDRPWEISDNSSRDLFRGNIKTSILSAVSAAMMFSKSFWIASASTEAFCCGIKPIIDFESSNSSVDGWLEFASFPLLFQSAIWAPMIRAPGDRVR